MELEGDQHETNVYPWRSWRDARQVRSMVDTKSRSSYLINERIALNTETFLSFDI